MEQLLLCGQAYPATWKNAKVVPLQKPNKPAHEHDSNRPVSILLPLAERIILPQQQVEESHNCVQSDHSLHPQLCLTSLGSKPRRNPLKETGSKTERRTENHHRVHKNDSNRPPLTRDTLPAVKTHNKILASQFPADMKNPDHPCHDLKANNEERRTIRKSLRNHLKTAQTTLDITEGEATRENLHKAYVIDTIVNLQPNRVLNTQHPINQDNIDEMEKTLTRQQQVRLIQMRSGFCAQLNDYLHRINASETDICRFCKKGKETVKHVLACLANLAPKTLWTNPKTKKRRD